MSQVTGRSERAGFGGLSRARAAIGRSRSGLRGGNLKFSGFAAKQATPGQSRARAVLGLGGAQPTTVGRPERRTGDIFSNAGNAAFSKAPTNFVTHLLPHSHPLRIPPRGVPCLPLLFCLFVTTLVESTHTQNAVPEINRPHCGEVRVQAVRVRIRLPPHGKWLSFADFPAPGYPLLLARRDGGGHMPPRLVSNCGGNRHWSLKLTVRAESRDLVIIGGGVAGYVAAIKAGQEGMKASGTRHAGGPVPRPMANLP